MDDRELLFQWANDAEVRQMAFNSKPIDWENHCQWFAEKLHDHRCFIYIACDDADTPMGQVRFDIKADGVAEIDVHMSPQQRGKGQGPEAIRRCSAQFFSDSSAEEIHALIRTENQRSQRAFERAGYRSVGDKQINGIDCSLMKKTRT